MTTISSTNHYHLYFSSCRSVFTDNIIQEDDFCQLHGEIIFITVKQVQKLRTVTRSTELQCHATSNTAGWQVTVGHWTMADQNLPMSNEIPTVIGQNVRQFFISSNANANVLH